jgi:transcriptional regulator with XRE-family HTH domain
MQESRRSVEPNGALIDSLRKRKGWTIEELALESDIGMRTAQKAIAGQPVSIDTLRVLAGKLDVAYDMLLAAEKPPEAGQQVLTLQIQIDLSGSGDDPAKAAKLVEVITFLKRFLPDNAGIAIIGTVAGGALIGVRKSAANEAAIADPALRLGLDALGVLSGERYEKPSSVPKTIRMLGSDEPHDYLASGEVYYQMTGPAKPWADMSGRERLEFCIKHAEDFLAEAEGNNPYNWPLIRGGKELDPKASPEELFAFAQAELSAIGDERTERRTQLWSLAHFSKNRDMLDQLRALLAELESH